MGYEADVLPPHPAAAPYDLSAQLYPLLHVLQVGIGGNDSPEIGIGCYEVGA